jgi:predicted ester cyclase
VTLDDLLAEGDKVVRRFTVRGTHRQRLFGEPAAGQLMTLNGIAIDRLAEGKLVESWVQIDGIPSRT